MSVEHRVAWVVGSICTSFFIDAAAAQPPPAEAFGALPATSHVAISPDGNLLAWNDQSSAEPRVAIYDLKTSRYKRYLHIPQPGKFRSVTWADDETALVTISFTRGDDQTEWSGREVKDWEVYRTIAADTDSTPGRILLMSEGIRPYVTGAPLIAWHTTKPKTVLMSTLESSTAYWGHLVMSLYEVDTRSGKGRPIGRGVPRTDYWIADGQGHIARVDSDPHIHMFSVQNLSGTTWREVYHCEDEAHKLAVHGFSEDGTSLIATGVIAEGPVKLWALPLDGSRPRVLLEDARKDVIGVRLDDFTGTPVTAWLSGTDAQEHWIEASAKARFDILQRSFPGQQVQIGGRSQTGQRVVARVSTASRPPIYYLVDFQTHKADIVGEEYPALAHVTLGELRDITYKARDGLEIPAYLTLPPGVSPQGLPMVVLPHGGPESRDFAGFNWWAQFLATRGYAVLQPQFRGSTGFGEAFHKAGYRQWGGLMQDDVSDGVGAIVSQGIADPKRICIVGASYGGFAALAGAAFTPTLYKCAVSINGVSNLPALHSTRQHSGQYSAGYWHERIGDPFDPALAAKSPVHGARDIKVPILLMHATKDSVVPFQQSEEMAYELKHAGKQVTLITLPGEDHWLSRAETRTRMLQELEKFLSANL